MESDESYSKAARFYRALLKGRDHIEPQVNVIETLIARSGMKNPRILDAACGSGEVLNELRERGFDAYGTDGSRELVELAKEHSRLQRGNCLLGIYKWQCLEHLFETQKTFDVIITLGHSLPHATEQDIPVILNQIYGGLKEGGLFAFDMRSWERNVSNQLIEPGRLNGIRRWLGEAVVEGRKCWIDDLCEYTVGKQRISYFVHFQDAKPIETESFSLEYTIFSMEKVKQWFEESQFTKPIECFNSKNPKWPYTIVVARK